MRSLVAPTCRELFGLKTEEIIELLSSHWLVCTEGGEEVVFLCLEVGERRDCF